MSKDTNAKDMKLKIKSPLILAEDYNAYKALIKKSFKEPEKLTGTEFVFIADFKFNGQDDKGLPILFLGTLNSEWKQAIRKDYKKKSTFAYGVCEMAEDASGAPNKILKLKYKGGKGAKDKNIKVFKKENKKHFTDVVFEQFVEEDGKIDNVGKNLLNEEETLLGAINNKEYVAIIKSFKVIQQLLHKIRGGADKDTVKRLETDIEALRITIATWKNAPSNANPKELSTIDSIEQYLNKVEAQITGNQEAAQLGISPDIYMITPELISIQGDIAEIRTYNGDKSGLDIRKELTIHIIEKATQWEKRYKEDKKPTIYAEEYESIQKYKNYAISIQTQLEARDNILDFRELRDDLEDLKIRTEADESKKATVIRLWLQELFTIQQQIEHWGSNNEAILSNTDDTTKEGKIALKYQEYTQRNGTIDDLRNELMSRLGDSLGDKFSEAEEMANIVEGATGYNDSTLTQLQELGHFDKELLKEVEDKELKNKLEALRKKLKKTELTNAEEKRFLLWQIQLEIERHISINGDHPALDDIKKNVEEKINGLGIIEADNDVYEQFLQKYNSFKEEEATLEPMNETIAQLKALQESLARNKKRLQQAKTDEDKEKLEEVIADKERELTTLNAQVDADVIMASFDKIAALLDSMSNLVLSWNSRYQASEHYDTVERGKIIHRNHKEAFLFLRNKSDDYDQLSDFSVGDEFLELREHLTQKVNLPIRDYYEDDSKYEKLVTKHIILHKESDCLNKKQEKEGVQASLIEFMSTYNSKYLKELQHKTSLWLFEANNLYYDSPLLKERIKIIQRYQNRLAPLMEYIPIKTKHFEAKQKEKNSLAVLRGIGKTEVFLENSLEELKKATTEEESEQAVMNMLLEIGMNKSGLGSEYSISQSTLSRYTKKYNREVLHSKKKPDFGEDINKIKEYYTNLIIYIKEDTKLNEVQQLQATLGEMEQNSNQYKKTQQNYLDGELTRLSRYSNHETEKKLFAIITKIKTQLTEESRQMDLLNGQIEKQQQQINLLKIGQITNGENLTEEEVAALKETATLELATTKENFTTTKERQLDINLKLEAFYTNIFKRFKGDKSAPLWDSLDDLVTLLPALSTEVDALKQAVEQEKEGGGMDLEKSLSVLSRYVISHKKSMQELVTYDSTDLDLKANKRVVKKLYGDNDTYKQTLEAFIKDKTDLYQELETVVSGKTVEELASLGEETLQKALQLPRKWEVLTMPIIGPNAKANIKLLQQQAAAIKKYKIRLEQAVASTGKGIRPQQEIHQYYQSILKIDQTLQGSVEELLADDTIKDRIDGLNNKFQYYYSLLTEAIEKAYQGQGLTAETFLANMYWDNTIKRLALKINAFKEHPSFSQENKEQWRQQRVDFLEEYEGNLDSLNVGFSIEEFKRQTAAIDLSQDNTIQELQVDWEKEWRTVQEEEVEAILAKGEEYQEELHDQLFKFRGVSRNDEALQKEALKGGLQKKVNEICARAQRLLELGETAAAKTLVRNIPATFLDSNFVAAKRIFEEVDTILHGEDRDLLSSNIVETTVMAGVALGKTLLESLQMDAFAKLARENPEIITEWSDFVNAGELSITFENNQYKLEATETASKEAKVFLKNNKAKLTSQAEDQTGQDIAKASGVLSTIALGIQVGMDIKGITDDLLKLRQTRKNGDVLSERQYARIIGYNVLSAIPSLTSSVVATYNTFDGLAKGQGLGDVMPGEGVSTEIKIVTASLELAKGLFAFAKSREVALLEANRKELVRQTVDSILDAGGSAATILKIFEVPGMDVAGDILALIKNIKSIVEKEAVYHEKKRTAHYMKVLKQVGEQDSSDYTDALKGIRKDSKKQRQDAGVDLALAGVDTGLTGAKLVGDVVGVGVAPVGKIIGIGVQLLQAIKTGGVFSFGLYKEYKNNKVHKEVKKLLIDARQNDYDAIAKIQSKSIHYAKAFLIGGVIDAAQEDNGVVHLKNDNISAAYLEQVGLDINQRTAQEIIEVHVGSFDMGLLTHRFERYHEDYKTTWNGDPETKIKEDLKTLRSRQAMRGDLDQGEVGTKVNIFLTQMKAALKAYKEVKIFKANHEYVNFVDKKLGKDGLLTKVTKEQKVLLQTVSSIIKEEIIVKVNVVLDELIQQEDDQSFEKFQFLQKQRARLEAFLAQIPNKALLN